MKKSHRYYTILTLLVAVVLLLSSLSINGGTVAKATGSDTISQKTIIKVGYLQNYAMINHPYIRGSEGFGYEYLAEIEKHTNYQFEFVSTSWAGGLDMLEKGDIDLFGTASMDEDRLQKYNFVKTPVCYSTATIYAPNSTELYYQDYDNFKGLTIGVMKGALYEDDITEYSATHGISLNIKTIDETSFDQYLEDGTIDIFVASSLFNLDDVKIIDELYSEPQYFMTSKSNEQLAIDIDNAITAIEEDNPYYNELLWNKYYGASDKAVQYITLEEKLALSQKDIYTVGYHADLMPISYLTSDGQVKGYAIDVMNIIAQELDIKVNYVPLHGDNGNGGKVDFALSPLYDQHADRGRQSEAYIKQNLLIIRKEGLSKSQVKNILVYDYATIDIEDFLSLYPNATVHKVYSANQWNSVLKKQDIDCQIVPDGREGLVLDDSFSNISVLEMDLPTGIVVSYDLPIEVTTALNKAILSLGVGVVDSIIAENIAQVNTRQTIIDFFIQHQLVIAFVVLVLISAFLIIVLFNRRKIKTLLEVDSLTGLMTRHKFVIEAQRIMTSAMPCEYRLVLLDIDKFNSVNNMVGTKQGDKILREVTGNIVRNVHKDALISRIQNDVFAILSPNDNTAVMTYDNAFQDNLKGMNINFPINFSIGVYVIEDTTEAISYMLDCAKTAKNIDKKTFGDTINYYTNVTRTKTDKETMILSAMQGAISNDEFYILIQPKIQLETQKPVGGEVLVRWARHDGTVIYPDEFIPLLEYNHFIIQLDNYVLDKTCEFIRDANVELPRIAVNVSAITLLQSDFVDNYMDIMGRYGIVPSQLALELTESSLSANYEQIKSVIIQLRQQGFVIAIDDFGKGASSLARISELEVDMLKIDKVFVDDITKGKRGIHVLRNIIAMASSLGITTLAEGVETKEQQSILIEYGCELAQGYFFDRPLLPELFLQRIIDASNIAYKPVLRSKRVAEYWSDYENLPYGVAVTANDQYSTIIQANSAFYDIIGYDKDSFKDKRHNHFTSILYDNLYLLVKKYLEEEQYKFSYDLRIVRQDGNVVWVHDMVEFDPVNNLFYITIIDITDKNKGIDKTMSYDEYSLKTEIAYYSNLQTFDYIYVTDVATNKLLYVNDNMISAFHLADESMWKGKEFFKVFYNVDQLMNPEFYNDINEQEFSQREVYNDYLQKHFITRAKLIVINGEQLRLHIATDITERVKMQNDLLLQSALLSCVEELYESKQSRKAFLPLLQHINKYYGGDSAYYFEINQAERNLYDVHAVTKEGIVEQSAEFKALTPAERMLLIDTFASYHGHYFDKDTISKSHFTPSILDIFDKGDIEELLFIPVRNEKNDIIGFIGVGNPTANHNEIDLIELVSHFLAIFYRNIELGKLEKEASITEEHSTYHILNVCNNIFYLDKAKEEIFAEVLSLMRMHYDASFSMLLSVADDNEKCTVLHINGSEEQIANKDEQGQDIYIRLNKRLIDAFIDQADSTGATVLGMEVFSREDRLLLAQLGFANVYLSPLYDRGKVLSGVLVLGNVRLTSRSFVLLQAVSKFLADYMQKLSLYESHEKEISLEPLTGVYNKIVTEQKISQLLSEDSHGVMYMIDIDDFKSVNDTYGHAFGDEVIFHLANALRDTFRKDDIVGRVGGDEFMVYCHHLVDRCRVVAKAKSLLSAFRDMYPLQQGKPVVSVSVGVCLAGNNDTFEQLYKKADEALYMVKSKGKDGIFVIN